MTTPFPIRLVALPAWPLVASEGRPFRTVASYRLAAYLTDGEHWLSLVLPNASLPPDAIRVPSPITLRQLLPAGTLVWIGDGMIRTAAGPAFALTPTTRRWDPRLWLPCPMLTTPALPETQRILERLKPRDEPMLAPVLARAELALESLMTALHHREQTTAIAPTVAQPLAGLGPGFTPAGDDLLLGWCLALTAAARIWSAARPWLEIRQSLARAAASRTTARSAAWLLLAGEGYFSRDLLLLARLTIEGRRAHRITVIHRIRDLGATSGWIAAYGFVQLLTRIAEIVAERPSDTSL